MRRHTIARECKGSVNREFPSQFLDKTLREIVQLTKNADSKVARAADTAKKLLNDLRFKKGAK